MSFKLKDLTAPDFALAGFAALGLVWAVNALLPEDDRSCYQNADGQMVMVDVVPVNLTHDEYKETVLPAGNRWKITTDGKCTDGEVTIPVTPREQRPGGPSAGL